MTRFFVAGGFPPGSRAPEGLAILRRFGSPLMRGCKTRAYDVTRSSVAGGFTPPALANQGASRRPPGSEWL